MTKAELIARLAADSGLSMAEARRVIEALFDSEQGIIARALRSGTPVQIAPFGSFSVKRGVARLGRNPRIGEQISISPKMLVTFRASDGLRDAVLLGRPGGAKSKAPRSKGRKAVPKTPTPAAGGGAKDSPVPGGKAPGEVRFTAYHPKEIKPRTWYALLAYAHVPEAFDAVQEDSRTRLGAAAASYGKGKGEATTVIKRGAEITVVPELPGCRFNPERASFTWLKDWHRAEFEVRAGPQEAGYAEGQAVNGRVAFYVGPVLVGEAKIWAHVSETADEQQAGPPAASVTADAYRKIFVSYAHEDAKIVDALERAYKALGDDYLRDVHALRAGQTWNPALLKMIEQADIFQLCWSTAARRSAYVTQEWGHALKQNRPAPFVRPTYWELPMPTPPAKLKGIHFAYLKV